MNTAKNLKPKKSKANKKKAASSSSIPLPPKPYTEYTIFFRLERSYLLQTSGHTIDEEVRISLDPNHKDPLDFSARPEKYKNVIMPPYWYSSSHKAVVEKKRKHRKREGRMDLKTLSKAISASWRDADLEVKDYCKKLSEAEWIRYNGLVENILADQAESEKQANAAAVAASANQQLSVKDLDMHPISKRFKTQLPVLNQTHSIMNNSNGFNLHRQDQVGNTTAGAHGALLRQMMMLQQLQLAHEKNMKSLVNPTPIQSTYQSCAPIQSMHQSMHQSYNPSMGEDEESNKRRCIRRISAPPVMSNIDGMLSSLSSMNQDCQQQMQMCNRRRASVSSVVSDGTMEGSFHADVMNENDFNGSFHPVEEPISSGPVFNMGSNTEEDSPPHTFKMNRRHSAAPVPSSSNIQELRDSFKQELERPDPVDSFTCVPKWEENDADTLLDILDDFDNDVPNQVGDTTQVSQEMLCNVDMASMMCGFTD